MQYHRVDRAGNGGVATRHLSGRRLPTRSPDLLATEPHACLRTVPSTISEIQRPLPYPGSVLGERSGRIADTVTDLAPCMVSYTDLEFIRRRDPSHLPSGAAPRWSAVANGPEDSFRVARY